LSERNIPAELRRGTGDSVFAELATALEGVDLADDIARSSVLAAASSTPALFPAYILLHEASGPAVMLKTTADGLAKSAAARGDKAIDTAEELGETRSLRTRRGYWLVHSDPAATGDALGFCAVYHDRHALPVTMFAGSASEGALIDAVAHTLTDRVLEPRSLNPLAWPVALLNSDGGEGYGTWQAWKLFAAAGALVAFDLFCPLSPHLLSWLHDWATGTLPGWGVVAAYAAAGLAGLWLGSLVIGAMQRWSTRRGLARDLSITRDLPEAALGFAYGREASDRVLGGGIRDALGDWLGSLAGVTGALVARIQEVLPRSGE